MAGACGSSGCRCSSGILGENIGNGESLRTSSLARLMFADIGALATVAAGWIIIANRDRYRYIFAIATLFVGSYAFLPYLAWKLLYKGHVA